MYICLTVASNVLHLDSNHMLASADLLCVNGQLHYYFVLFMDFFQGLIEAKGIVVIQVDISFAVEKAVPHLFAAK